jgi:putative hemolysin
MAFGKNTTLALGLTLAILGTGISHAAPIKLGGPGTGAPQSIGCAAAGGTESGNMCTLPNGISCQSMALVRDNECLDVEGNLIEEGEDTGSNMGPEDSNAPQSDSDSSE